MHSRSVLCMTGHYNFDHVCMYICVAESLCMSPTTFTQCALKAIEVAEIKQKTAITPFKVIQGHRF